MRRALGDAHAVLPQQRALGRDGIGEILVLGHHLQHVAVPLHAEVDLARGKKVLAVVVGEHLDVLLLLDQQILRLLDLRRIDGIEGIAEIFERAADDILGIAKQRQLAGMLVAVEQRLPTVDHAVSLALAVADAERSPHIGNGELASGIERRILEGLFDVGHVGNLAVIDRRQHCRLDHPLDKVVGRDDHVIAGVAFLELGEQLVIVGIEIHLHHDAGRLVEICQGGLADIRVPIVEIELLLLLRQSKARQKGQAGNGRGATLQELAAIGEEFRANAWHGNS